MTDTPEQVTDAMIAAAWGIADGVDDSAFRRIYLAMHAARPQVQGTDALVEDVIEKARDPRYSNEFIGNCIRAALGRSMSLSEGEGQ